MPRARTRARRTLLVLAAGLAWRPGAFARGSAFTSKPIAATWHCTSEQINAIVRSDYDECRVSVLAGNIKAD
jgi:hypothetical protein